MDMPSDLQNQAMGYDRTATMFSPEGTILQVEYAEKTIRLGSTSVGMVCTDGVFILADKRVTDKLVVQESSNKVQEIDSHVIASAAGIVSDARVLIERAQILAQQHRVTYDSPIEPESLVREISNLKQQFTQYGGARPFGVSIMVGGINGKRLELYTSDVTGNYLSYYANSIGENDEKIKERLREKYSKELNVKKGVKLALQIIKDVQGSKFDINRFELAYIRKEDGKLIRVEREELKNFGK